MEGSEKLNGSGWRPTGYRVLVRPAKVEEISKGGIILGTYDAQKKEEMAQIQGTLIACGPSAFQERADVPPMDTVTVGTQVLFSKYGGLIIRGRDGLDYRMLNDLDIVGVEESHE